MFVEHISNNRNICYHNLTNASGFYIDIFSRGLWPTETIYEVGGYWGAHIVKLKTFTDQNEAKNYIETLMTKIGWEQKLM